MLKLNFPTRWQEYRYVITSCIRMLSSSYFTPQAVRCMARVSRRLYMVELEGGSISDDRLFDLYCEELDKDESMGESEEEDKSGID